ncbi:protein FAM149B1-like isoform X2 [Littorina saxatilis]|uniref:protein FAM149B1-like isoform X2 n=1 Tax=Littorina saxatilis TaxID=31220 RepID=UPI0038B51257
MIHLEIVGSSASPRAGLLTRMDMMDSRAGRVGSPSVIGRVGPPSVMYPPSTPIRRTAGIIRLRSGSRNRRAVVKTPQQGHVPLPEPADKDLPQDYIASVHNAIASYNTTPTSSGRSSPTNADTHSTLSVSQGGWTTGNTTERSSLDSSCYSLDEFDKQAASTVNQHFEEFESMLFEGPRETKSNAYRECQEWVTQFPHLRALGKQVLAPKDTGYHFTPTSTSISTTPRPSTSGTLEENDLSLATDTQGLTLSGRKVKATRAPPESTKLSSRDRHHDNSHISSEYDFLHEEVFAQDGVYEDIIAVDYKNIYEDNMEHKKQITPRRRRVGYPPITPNACVKDSVLSAAFDTMWFEIMSWMRLLMKKYAAEVEAKKELGALDHSLIHAPPRTSSFIYEQARSSNPINDILKVSTMPLVNRTNPFGPGPPDVPDSMVLMNPPGLWRTNLSRPPTVNQLRWRPGQGRSLDPLHERSKVQNSDESRSHQPNPQNALRVKQIMPTGVPTHHRLSSPPNPMAGRLPPLEPSAILTSSHCKFGNRASSAIDNKEGRNLAGREKSNNAVEFSRPSTTQAFNRQPEPSYNMNRRSSTPLGQNRGVTYLNGQSVGLGIMGSGLHPSAEHPSNILEDEVAPKEDIRHNQWIPSTPSYNNMYFRRQKTLRY